MHHCKKRPTNPIFCPCFRKQQYFFRPYLKPESSGWQFKSPLLTGHIVTTTLLAAQHVLTSSIPPPGFYLDQERCFSSTFVCLFVCLFVGLCAKTVLPIITTFGGNAEHRLRIRKH